MDGSDGTDGVNACTSTTADYQQPQSSQSVYVYCADASWMSVGQIVYVAGGGYYTVNAISNDHLRATLINLGYPGNAQAGSTISFPASVSAAGLRGAAGADGSIGPTGPAGADGAPGATGATGPTGPAGTTDHAALSHLAYANAGHTGFAQASHAHAGNDITSGTLDGARLPAMSATKLGGVPATGTPTGLILSDSGFVSAPTASDIYILSPADKPPASPNALDDEFTNAATLPGGGSAKWAWRNQGTSTAVIQAKRLILTPSPNTAGTNLRILEQSAPAGAFTCAVKFHLLSPELNYSVGTLLLMNAAGTKWAGLSVVVHASGLNQVEYEHPSAVTNWGTNGILVHSLPNVPGGTTDVYLRFSLDAGPTNISYQGSYDGINWITYRAETVVSYIGDVAKMGISADDEGAAGTKALVAKWFRVNWTPDYA